MSQTMRRIVAIVAMAYSSSVLGPTQVASQAYSPPPPDQDIWTTSVYSYAPSGGGPGGGLADQYLKVGGWGDLYYSLIQFDLAGLPKHAPNVKLRLYNINAASGTPIQLN